jgi:ATP-dependent Lon protease
MDSQRPRRRSARGSASQRARREELTAAIVSELAQNEVMYRQAVPVLPIRNAVVLPNMVTPLYIDHVKTRRAIKAAYEGEGVIFAVTQRSETIDNPGPHDLYHFGIEAVIEKIVPMPDGVLSVVLRCLRRARTMRFHDTKSYLCADIETYPELADDSLDAAAQVRVTREHFEKAIKNNPRFGDDSFVNVLNLVDAGGLADAIAMSLELPLQTRQTILETLQPLDRLQFVDRLLVREMEILEIETRIHHTVQQELDRTQREYYLREQIKTIQRELSEHDPAMRESADLRERIHAANMPDEVQARALREVERLDAMPTMAPEYTVLRNYIDWLLALPWKQQTTDQIDLAAAADILDTHHHGLSKVKERLLEFLAVRKLAPQSRSPILCLVGSPGVGKTSLGRSIAEALGRKFVRVSLGGVRDEAEIRGHRRTYVGALPGRIVQTMRTAGVINPIFVLDEIDKLASDYRGDPASALLEVLDPEQNHAFSDHYLEVPYDLSKVIFILTANSLQPIPPALLDRMEVIELPGYTEEEKAQIAKHFLIARQMKDHGLAPTKIEIRDEAVHRIIREYTHEAGVRNLEREIGAMMRKVARRVAEGKRGKANITAARVPEYLGPPRGFAHEAEEQDQIGVAMGVAWTPTGGDLTPVEVAVLDGRGQILFTGHLGDILRESAQAALSFARARAVELGLPAGFHEKYDLHMHLPMGAVHKDGPSAGVPIAMAIISALTGRAVRSDVAMTGEITLRGRIMPVGGVKEKLLAAHRAGLKRFILPRKNVPDLEEVPAEIREELCIIPVDHLDQVMQLVLGSKQPNAQPSLAAVVTDISTAGAEQHPRAKPALLPDIADDPVDEVARPADKPNSLPAAPSRDPQPVAPRPMVGVN